MFLWVGVEVLNDVLALSFEQMREAMLPQELNDFFPRDEASAGSVKSAEGSVGLEAGQSGQVLSLRFNALLFFGHCEHQVCD